MIAGVELIECKLTPEEWQVIEFMRDLKVEFGKIQLSIYFQNGKLNRVETEKVIESRVIKT